MKKQARGEDYRAGYAAGFAAGRRLSARRLRQWQGVFVENERLKGELREAMLAEIMRKAGRLKCGPADG